MNFRVEEACRRYYQSPDHAVIVGVEHVFVEALRQLLDDYAGGGVFHYAEWSKLSLKLTAHLLQTQERWQPPSPLDLIDSEQVRQVGGSGRGVVGFALSGPPPGWRPPFTKDYAELVARHKRTALQRGDSYTTIYEVLADVLTYPQVARLLEAVGQSADEIAERVKPYLDPNLAAKEVGPDVRRWQMVMVGLMAGAGFLEPRPEQPTRVFRISGATHAAMRLGMDTLTLRLLFLGGIEQVLRDGRRYGDLTPDPLLGPLIVAIEKELTGGKPLPSYVTAKDSMGQTVIQGKVPTSMIKVPREVERFLYKHRDIAAQRGEAFTTYTEVLVDLLSHQEIRDLLTGLGFNEEKVRSRISRLT